MLTILVHSKMFLAFLIAVAICLLWVAAYYFEIWRLKRTIDKGPRVGMTLCDKGHLYPSKESLHITVDAVGEVELCPICFDTNMRNAEKLNAT